MCAIFSDRFSSITANWCLIVSCTITNADDYEQGLWNLYSWSKVQEWWACTFESNTAVGAVASVPIPGGCSLRPVKNRGRSFDKVTDHTVPLIFTGQTTPLTKLSSLFFVSPLFFISHPQQNSSPYFLLPPMFTGQTTPLSNLSPIFYFSLVF